MKAKRSRHLYLLIALSVATFIAFQPNRVVAYSIVVDGDPSDWTGAPPPYENLGHLSRDTSQHGEYIWNDLPGDERSDFASPDTLVDLTQFRVSADGHNLTFLAKMTDIDQVAGDGAPQIQVAIDTDQVNGSGEAYLYGFSDTRVDPVAEWEYLAVTRFGSGSSDLILWQNGFVTQIYTGTEAISAVSESIEFSLPWTALGMAGPPSHPLRFTVATFRSAGDDGPWLIPGTSGVLDALTNYGDPGDVSSNTWAEVFDGVQNYYIDLYFKFDGDVCAPLLISEVLYDPSGDEPAAEFIELYNPSLATLDLALIKVGDEEQIGGNEGMARFPGGSVSSGGVIVLANDADTFTNRYGFLPNYALNSGGQPVSTTVQYAAWSTGNSIDLGNDGDEILLLDGQDTVLDVVEYEDGEPEWPGLTGTAFSVADGSSMERRPVTIDTDDIASDFAASGGDGSPGQVLDHSVYLPLTIKGN